MQEAVRTALTGVLIAAAGGLTFLRLYVRQWLHRGLNNSNPSYWIGDSLCTLGFLLYAGYVGCDLWYRHVQVRDAQIFMVDQQKMMEFYTKMLKMIFFQTLGVNISVYCIKGSFLCFYFSTIKALNKKVVRLLIGITVFTGIAFATQTGYFVFMCQPISSFWTLSESSCIYTNWDSLNGIYTAFHMATDLTTMIMGFTVVNQSLTLTRRGWYCIFFIFALASLTILISCIRITLAYQLLDRVRKGAPIGSATSKNLDEWTTLCSISEMGIGLIAVCLPAFRVWWRVHISGDALSHLPSAAPRSRDFGAAGSGFSKYVSNNRSAKSTKVSMESERRLQSEASVEMGDMKA